MNYPQIGQLINNIVYHYFNSNNPAILKIMVQTNGHSP